MYKLNLEFISDKVGIYTKEEETCDDEFWKDIKYNRMIGRWLEILCPHIDIKNFENQLISDINYKLGFTEDQEESKKRTNCMIETKKKLIENHLELTNEIFGETRSFKIIVSKI